MLNQYKTKREEGFTIIEVLIVLAIAGLIILIVFLAVPALQRNSRNTQRKNDISALVGAIQEYSNNKNGSLPGSQTDLDKVVDNAKMGYYTDSGRIFYNDGSTLPTVPGTIANGDGDDTTVTSDNIIVVFNSKCDANPTDAPISGSQRSVAIVYAVESSGDPVFQCQQN